LLRDGVTADQAELARLAYVTPSRLSQVMALLQFAPEIQKAVLFLPPTFHPGITTVLARFRVEVRISDAEYRNAGAHSPPRRGTGTLVEQSPMKFTAHFVYADCLQSAH
jgi:hypothetical protein